MTISARDIYLRPLVATDATDRYASWLNDPDIHRYLMVRYKVPLTKEDAFDFIEHAASERYPHWGIFVRGEGDRHVGNVTASSYNLRDRWIDISFLIGEKDLWGQGIATTAVASVLDYLFFEGFHRVQAGVCDANVSSIRTLKKLGFTAEARLREAALIDGVYKDDLKFGLLLREWQAGKFAGERCTVLPLAWSFFKDREPT